MYIIGHDIGTSAVKSVLADARGRIVARASAPLVVLRPAAAMSEQRPSDWLDAIAANTRMLLAHSGAPADAVVAVSFAAQMQGTLPVDANGEPLMNAMIWLDMRAERHSRRAVRGWPSVQGYGLYRLWRWLRLTNGVPGLSGRDPVAKILWLMDEAPEVWAATHKVLDVKDYLLAFATGRYVTSRDCANTTWLMDTREGKSCWSSELCARLGIDPAKLPSIASSTERAGTLTPRAAERFGLRAGTQVFVGAGDLAAFAIGAGATAERQCAVSLGTSAWVSAHVAERVHDLRTYTASICSAADDLHLVVAHQEAGGACLEWLRSHWSAEASFDDLLARALEAPPGAAGLVFLPWMNGEYAPIDDPFVRGGFLNLSFAHGVPHLCRALLEGVAYNVRWALAAVDALAGGGAEEVRIGGGGARSGLWCQTLADAIQRPVVCVREPQLAVAHGAAIIGLVGLGALAHYSAAEILLEGSYAPNARAAALHERGYSRLKDAYYRHRTWYRASMDYADSRPGR